MKTYRLFLWPVAGLIVTLVLLLSPLLAAAQGGSPIEATVNRSSFSTDELVILTVKVVDDSALQPRPILPRLDGLAVVDLDISTDVSVNGGKMHTEVIYTYRLQPRRTGLLVIPPVTVKIGGQTFRAAPISIQVSQGNPPTPSSGNAVKPANISPPPGLAGQDFFVESLVDPPDPYVGQQMVYTFRFYQAIQLYRQPQYESPLFTGFETLGMPVQEYNLDLDGRTYLISEIRTALFAQHSGTITIDAARLMFPGNIYEEPVELYSEPVTVQVQPLPAGAPPNFNGAVGQYEIQAWFSPQVAVIQQPASLYVAISGVGNIQTLPEPVWPELNGWRTYDSLTSLTSDVKDGQMAGTRVFERLVVPDQEGDFTISPASFVFFDPVAQEYRTISAQPVTVKVIPPPTPDPAAVTPTAVAAIPAATPAVNTPPDVPVQPVESPVNSIFSNLREYQATVPLPLFVMVILGMCGLTPLAAAAGAGAFWWWQQKRHPAPAPAVVETPEVLHPPGAKMHPVLAATLKGSRDNYQAASRALYAYLRETLRFPVQGLSRSELISRLRRHPVDDSLVRRIDDCLAQSEMGRYGPSSGDPGWSLLAETEELLFELDRAFGRENQGNDQANAASRR